MAESTGLERFSGLPLGLLICGPIIEVAKGQAELCRVYLEYVLKLAYKGGKIPKEGEVGEANLVSFTLNRPVTDGKGNITQQAITVNAPLLCLVPVPAFTMQEATVQFTMEVGEQTVDKASVEKEAGAEFGASYWGFTAKISGKVTTKSENTRTTDFSAKYDISAKAVQQPPAEGMARLNQVFASVIEPIEVGSGGG